VGFEPIVVASAREKTFNALARSAIVTGIMPCSPLKINQLFGRTCGLYLQGQRVRQARNENELGKIPNDRTLRDYWDFGLSLILNNNEEHFNI
jgi:hypothetical protein